MRPREMLAVLLVVGAFTVLFVPSDAAVRLPAIFSDHMVLQRDRPVPVWGWASPGETVTVRCATASATTVADKDGRWKTTLPAMPASETPVQMTVTSSDSTVTVSDILVGDVWVCSGQSNMQWALSAASNGREEIARAQYPGIRFFKVPRAAAFEPQTDCAGSWSVCSPATAGGFSAVGYFFGREIHLARRVPVGLIGSYVGGTPAQAWTSIEGLDAHQELRVAYGDRARQVAAQAPEMKAAYDRWLAEGGAEYLAAVSRWNTAARQARQRGEQPPPRPQPPATPEPPNPSSTLHPTVLYNGMIAPLVPYAVTGIIWYQGESNAGQILYHTLFPAMIADWRKKWGQGDIPFLFVQLPNYRARTDDPNAPTSWALAREAQMLTLRLPKTGMATTIDIGDGADLHPPFKEEVGRRLALEARRIVYGEQIVSRGPLYASHRIDGNRVRVTFTDVGAGLKIGAPPAGSKTPAPAQDSVRGFAVAGADGTFVWAKAIIEKPDTVVVWSDEVPQPVAVRYGWADNPEVNLYNSADLPASPFRTDMPPRKETP